MINSWHYVFQEYNFKLSRSNLRSGEFFRALIYSSSSSGREKLAWSQVKLGAAVIYWTLVILYLYSLDF